MAPHFLFYFPPYHSSTLWPYMCDDQLMVNQSRQTKPFLYVKPALMGNNGRLFE